MLADDSLFFLVDKNLRCFSHFTLGGYTCFACNVLLVNLSLDSSTDTAALHAQVLLLVLHLPHMAELVVVVSECWSVGVF